MISENLEILTNYLWHESNKKINTVLSEHQMNVSDYYYLVAISNMEKPNFGDVAKVLNLTKPAISALIRRLMQNELIEKKQCQDDRRVFYLSLTEKGKALISSDHQMCTHIEQLLTTKLSPSRVKEFDEILNLVVSLLPNQNSF